MKPVLSSIELLANPPAVEMLISALDEKSFRAARYNRLERVQRLLDQSDVDVLVLSLGADLPWLSGYEAMPLERLTALVISKGSLPTLIVPELEAPRVRLDDELFKLLVWREGTDPYALVAELGAGAKTIAVSDRMWARALLELQRNLPGARWISASALLAPLRGTKDDLELVMLARAAHITDSVAFALLDAEIPMAGLSEKHVSADISRRLIAAGLARVNFAIVGSGPNSASPHHEPGARLIEVGDPVVCDFGGVYSILDEPGYCSDITRTVVVGEVPDGFMELYDALALAQNAARSAVSSFISGQDLDRVARAAIAEAGYGEFFIHRTGHGIGLEEHEEPYVAIDNSHALGARAAFSIEPGIYLPGRYGARIEDICVSDEDRGVSLNLAPRKLSAI